MPTRSDRAPRFLTNIISLSIIECTTRISICKLSTLSGSRGESVCFDECQAIQGTENHLEFMSQKVEYYDSFLRFSDKFVSEVKLDVALCNSSE